MSNLNLGLSSVVSFGMAAAAKNTEDVIDSKKTKKAGQAPQQKTQTNTPAKDAKVEAEAKAVYDKFVEATTKFFEFFTEPFKGGNGDHKIKEGECLSEIAEKYGCSLAELQELNNIKDPDKIKEGQVLKIPATSKNANNPEVTKVPAGQYTVKAGDNLTEIAKNFNCSVADLQKANNIQAKLAD